ncbi:MAG: hypothetical protein DRJ09_05575 [Bacteroidetes bacterium]|nr:MAG: hypothetical protein DRJ09_05575 [Bacteroidota bacterium]
MKRISFVILLILLLFDATFSQNQANLWYFGAYCGLDFNAGFPIKVNSTIYTGMGTAVMSDSLGNLLFYSDGDKIYNKNYSPMLNGEVLMGDDPEVTQRVVIVQKPESSHLFYVFFVGIGSWSSTGIFGFWYCLVDMNGDNGLGEVTKKNILINAAWDAQEKLFAVKYSNNKDVWIITHKLQENQFASFLLTKNGLNTNPVLSSASVVQQTMNRQGYMKISYDKRFFFNAYENTQPYFFEVGKFNDTTGEINILYYLTKIDAQGRTLFPYGIEFSPDSKLVYIAFRTKDNDVEIYQYDMQYVENHSLFTQSAILIGKGAGIALQLARDGKIYCSGTGLQQYQYVSVINKPWIRGVGCNYQKDVIYYAPLASVYYSFPNILLDYLYRFEWVGECSGPDNVVQFKPNFMFPDSIHWNFGDPASGVDSISHKLAPTHIFSSGGEFEVAADVWYPPDTTNPFGRYEHTLRVVTIKQSPLPDLGSDTLVCKNNEIELNGGAGAGSYLWNTGEFGFNDSLITVSDTGTYWAYWVKVNAPNGCTTIDSVFVGWNPPAVFDETNLTITPTSCGGSSGSITGLQVVGVPPLSFSWQDADGNVLGNSLDISGLGVENYYLSASDGNGCSTLSGSYTITDAGDIIIDTVTFTPEHCGQDDGTMTVIAHSGGSSYFRYSINDGASFQENDSVFIALAAGSYVVRVSDTNGCQSVYGHNPVVIDNSSAPHITNITTFDETNLDQNGEIIITADVFSGSIHYSINNGNSFQLDDGDFSNLSAGTYPCMVADDFGCDTTFMVVVNRVSTQQLEALAGDDHSCLGDAAVVPLVVSGFDSVVRFRTELFYDSSVLSCTGYQNPDASIADKLQVQLVQNDNRVLLSWEGDNPVSVANGSRLAELVFDGKKEGYSLVDWAHSAGESYFYNTNGLQIPALYNPGNVRIFSRPGILLESSKKVCENDQVLISPFVSGGSGTYEYL